jgi:hypothetical protein
MREADPDWESTLSLLTRVREGDDAALNELFGRYHLVTFAAGTKTKTVGPAFAMPVQMTFATNVVP